MLEPAVVILRLFQYAGAMVLMGSSLFFLCAPPHAGETSAVAAQRARRLVLGAGILLAVSAAAGLLARTSVLAGSIEEGLKPSSLSAVITGMGLGRAAIIRITAATAAVLLVAVLRPGRVAWIYAAALGAVATASFAWAGHGAATEGQGRLVHLLSDIAHGWAAAAWIGALAALVLMICTPGTPESLAALHRALHGFSGVGKGLVTVLLGTGLINSWFLIGPERLDGLWTTPYGRLLSLKIAAFIAMLALAAANRFRHTPALGAAIQAAVPYDEALGALRRSVALETALGLAVLGLVAWFGTLAPPSAL